MIRPGGWESLTQISARLGEGPESIYEQTGYELQPGETLALFTDGALETAGADGKPLGEVGMGKLLQAAHAGSAAEIATMLRQRLEVACRPGEGSGSNRVSGKTQVERSRTEFIPFIARSPAKTPCTHGRRSPASSSADHDHESFVRNMVPGRDHGRLAPP